MVPQDKLLGLIGLIYDAAGDARKWPAFLQDFSEAVDCAVAAIAYHDLKTPRAISMTTRGFDPHYVSRYVDYYGAFDPWRTAWLARFGRESPEAIVSSDELVGLNQIRRSEFYNDYLVPQDTIYQLGGPILIREQRWCSIITCLRPRKKGPFGSAEVEFLRQLFPHLQRVYWSGRVGQVDRGK